MFRIAKTTIYQIGPPWQDRETAVPGSGFTPPNSGTPPRQPQQSPRRDPAALRHRANYNSADWHRWKMVQGLLFGGMLAAPGLLLIGIAGLQSGSDAACLFAPGVLAILAGVTILFYYLLAPFAQKWIITVPTNQFWAVEDLKGRQTLAFLAPGGVEIKRKFDTRIVPYVGFNSLTVCEVIPNILGMPDMRVDIEVTAVIQFNPTEADPEEFNTLRAMTNAHQFEYVLRREIFKTVQLHMGRYDLMRSRSLQDTVQSLESAVVEHLSNLHPLGLQPASARPVSITISAPGAVRQHFRQLWERGARNTQESEIIRDIRDMMDVFNLSYEDAARQYYLLKHGVEMPPPATAPVQPPSEPDTVERTESGTQTSWEARTYTHASNAYSAPTTVHREQPASHADQEHTITRHPGPIRDAEDAPDPFDLRDQRRDNR